MFRKITTFLAVTLAALVFTVPTNAQAESSKTGINSLRKQLNDLPRQKAPFSKIRSLVTKLASLDSKNAVADLTTGLGKIAILNAEKNAAALTNQVNIIVRKSKTLTAKEKSKIVNATIRTLKRYVPPRPSTGGPYQAALPSRSDISNVA